MTKFFVKLLGTCWEITLYGRKAEVPKKDQRIEWITGCRVFTFRHPLDFFFPNLVPCNPVTTSKIRGSLHNSYRNDQYEPQKQSGYRVYFPKNDLRELLGGPPLGTLLCAGSTIFRILSIENLVFTGARWPYVNLRFRVDV